MTDEKEDFRAEFDAIATSEGVDGKYADSYYNLVFELATGLASRNGAELLVVAISGSQGSGKTTFAKMLAILLERVFEKATLVLSLDDFYLTRAERADLARRVHPLLRIRGVPGTHDVPMMQAAIADLRAGLKVRVPQFSKADDDRTDSIPVMGSSLNILIVEGWCWGATPGSAASLEQPINVLEETKDADGIWRQFVNEQLATGGYQTLFAEPDSTFFFAAPSFETVTRWRWQQEQRIIDSGGAHVMTEDEVREFVMLYERITRRMMDEMPARANLTMFLDEHHRVKAPRRDQFRKQS